MLPEFELVQPRTLPEALRRVGADGNLPLAGGTNVLVDLRASRTAAAGLCGLERIGPLRGVRRTNRTVVVGACTRIADLLDAPCLERQAPALVAAARLFAGASVRNAATLGGNVCHASPAADLVPPLLCLDADAVLRSVRGERTVPLDGFFRGVRKTVRRPDELLTELRWPLPPRRSTGLYYKLGLRKADAVAVVGVAVSLAVEAGVCRAVRIALGAVAPTALRARRAEGLLCGQALTPALAEEAARQAAGESRPIDDARASAEYRLHVVHVLVRRLLTEAWDRLAV